MKKNLSKIYWLVIDTITIIFNPRYWHMIDTFCDRKWNRKLSNYPYGAFAEYSDYNSFQSGRPTRWTILRAKRKLDLDRRPTSIKRNEKLEKLGIL